jgi:hypothetical protein
MSHLSDPAEQPDACHPGGNGTNGQTIWLSLAACGRICTIVLAIGAGSAKRRRAHCKFIGRPDELSRNSIAKVDVSSIKLPRAKTARPSQIASTLEKSTRSFNRF